MTTKDKLKAVILKKKLEEATGKKVVLKEMKVQGSNDFKEMQKKLLDFKNFFYQIIVDKYDISQEAAKRIDLGIKSIIEASNQL